MTAGACALLTVIGGGVAGIAALTSGGPDAPRIVTAVGQAAETGAGAEAAPPAAPPLHEIESPQVAAKRAATLPRISDKADRTGTREPHAAADTPAGVAKPAAPANPAAPAPAAPPKGTAPKPAQPAKPSRPQLTTRTELEKRDVPFETRFVRDPTLPRGARKVQAAGVPGEETLRYLVSLTDGQETDRKLMDITVTRQPQDRVIAFGSRRGFDRPHGDRCKDSNLDLCVPLGRRAACPEESTPASISVLDQDIAVVGGDSLGELPQMRCEGE